jgi:hypothetical protein
MLTQGTQSSMPVEIIETEKYVLTIDAENRYLEYLIKEDVTYDVADAKETKSKVVSRYPGMKFYVLAEGIGFFSLTKDARAYCATKEHLDNVVCQAFFTKNVSLLLICEVYVKINKPVVPTKFFSNREKAVAWLKEQMKNKDSDL